VSIVARGARVLCVAVTIGLPRRRTEHGRATPGSRAARHRITRLVRFAQTAEACEAIAFGFAPCTETARRFRN